jgi:hypothetical protein
LMFNTQVELCAPTPQRWPSSSTEERAKLKFPSPKSEERSWKAGETQLMPAEQHLRENLNDKPLELILVELKG